MDSLFKTIDIFYRLTCRADTALSPSPSSTTDISTMQTSDTADASAALSAGGQTLVDFMKKHGKDMSQAYPGRAYLYDFTGKPGSTCLLDNHIVHFSAKLIPVEKEKKAEMTTDYDQTVKYLTKWIKRDSATTDIADNPQAIENLIVNLLTQKEAEHSTYNYNFGFIQATDKAHADSNWEGHVFVIADYNTRNGVKVPYIWPYVSMTTFEKGINFWLDFLKARGFMNSAKMTGQAFVEALQKGRYFDLPMKDVVNQETGKKERVVDEMKAKEVRDRYYKNSLGLTQNKNITRAIQRYVYGNMNG